VGSARIVSRLGKVRFVIRARIDGAGDVSRAGRDRVGLSNGLGWAGSASRSMWHETGWLVRGLVRGLDRNRSGVSYEEVSRGLACQLTWRGQVSQEDREGQAGQLVGAGEASRVGRCGTARQMDWHGLSVGTVRWGGA